MPQPLAMEIQPFASIYDMTTDYSSRKLSVMDLSARCFVCFIRAGGFLVRAKGCRSGCGKEGIANSIVTVDNKYYYYLCYFTCNNFGGFSDWSLYV